MRCHLDLVTQTVLAVHLVYLLPIIGPFRDAFSADHMQTGDPADGRPEVVVSANNDWS